MSVSLERLVRNQIIFREVNDRIRDVVESVGQLQSDRVDFICECSNRDCIATIELELSEYKTIRSSPRLFVVRPGHEIAAVEDVIETNDRFTLVEKTRAVQSVEDAHTPANEPTS
jgi:hypothetical protein